MAEYDKIPIFIPKDRLIQAAGNSKTETGFKKRTIKFNLFVCSKIIIPIFIPNNTANIKGNIIKNPEITFTNKDKEFDKNIVKNILRKESSELRCFLTRFHIHKGYHKNTFKFFFTTKEDKTTPTQNSTADNRNSLKSTVFKILT